MDESEAFVELAPDADLWMFLAFDTTSYPNSRKAIMFAAKPMAEKGSIVAQLGLVAAQAA
jgi:hypothetical protein